MLNGYVCIEIEYYEGGEIMLFTSDANKIMSAPDGCFTWSVIGLQIVIGKAQ